MLPVISLEFVYNGFKAPPVYEQEQIFEGLPAFLAVHGSQITKLTYIEQEDMMTTTRQKEYRQLITKHCPNMQHVKLAFTEYPSEIYDCDTKSLVEFLVELAPRLTSLETKNNVIGLRLDESCMGLIEVYENFSDKIKCVKTDELTSEELFVLAGEYNNENPVLSLEELIYNDNDYLCSKRIRPSPESLALKPAALVNLMHFINLKRIDLPFLLTKEKILPVTSLPRLNYASIRLLTNRKGNLTSTSSFIENIGKFVANAKEIKLCDFDPGLLVLSSIVTNCITLEKLDLTGLIVGKDWNMGIAKLAGITLKFKQLDAKIGFSSPPSSQPHEFHMILYFLKNVQSLKSINILGINNEDTMDELIAASVSLAEKSRHQIALKLEWSHSSSEKYKSNPKEPPTRKPDNLTISINCSD